MTLFFVVLRGGQLSSMNGNKHTNYEILNLIGYGLAKFGILFVNQFGLKSKSQFYEFIVIKKIADTIGTIKNRQDLFDPFFENGRKGWWQKGDAYIHRKLLIDSLFGDLDCYNYSQIVKIYINKNFDNYDNIILDTSPIIASKFKQLQQTGLESELFFLNNYNLITKFKGGIIQDARLLGDGYDFQIDLDSKYFLAEIKGVRKDRGAIRLTHNEYKKAGEYKNDYFVVIISNLENIPKITAIENPLKNLRLEQKEIISSQIYYQSSNLKW